MKRRNALRALIGASSGSFLGLYPKTTDLETGLRWSFIQSEEQGPRELLQSGGEIYFLSDSLYVLDSETGAVRWSFREGVDSIVGIEHLSDRRVYLRTAEGFVALDRATGTERWRMSGPQRLAFDSKAIYTVSGRTLAAFEKETQSQRWQTDYEGTHWKSPTVVSDAVLLGTTSGSVAAFDIDGGESRWTFSVQSADYLRPLSRSVESQNEGQSAETRTVVVWNATESTLYGVSLEDGTRRWTYELDADLSWFPGTVTDTQVVLTDETRTRAIDLRTGETRWEFTALDGTPLSPPAVTDERIFVERAGTVTSLSLSGTVEWERSLDDGPNSRIGGIGDEAMCLYEPDGTVFVLSSTTGSLRRKYELDEKIPVPPVVSGETLYSVTEKGELFALDATRRTLSEFVRHDSGVVGGGLAATTVLTVVALRRLRETRD